MWSMSLRIRQIVAGLIGLCMLAGFMLGLQGAPEKGRLPGESSHTQPSTALEAEDAKPLVEDIPDPVAQSEKPPTEPEVPLTDASAASGPTASEPAAARPGPHEDKVGDLIDATKAQAPEEPPH